MLEGFMFLSLHRSGRKKKTAQPEIDIKKETLKGFAFTNNSITKDELLALLSYADEFLAQSILNPSTFETLKDFAVRLQNDALSEAEKLCLKRIILDDYQDSSSQTKKLTPQEKEARKIVLTKLSHTDTLKKESTEKTRLSFTEVIEKYFHEAFVPYMQHISPETLAKLAISGDTSDVYEFMAKRYNRVLCSPDSVYAPNRLVKKENIDAFLSKIQQWPIILRAVPISNTDIQHPSTPPISRARTIEDDSKDWPAIVENLIYQYLCNPYLILLAFRDDQALTLYNKHIKKNPLNNLQELINSLERADSPEESITRNTTGLGRHKITYNAEQEPASGPSYKGMPFSMYLIYRVIWISISFILCTHQINPRYPQDRALSTTEQLEQEAYTQKTRTIIDDVLIKVLDNLPRTMLSQAGTNFLQKQIDLIDPEAMGSIRYSTIFTEKVENLMPFLVPPVYPFSLRDLHYDRVAFFSWIIMKNDRFPEKALEFYTATFRNIINSTASVLTIQELHYLLNDYFMSSFNYENDPRLTPAEKTFFSSNKLFQRIDDFFRWRDIQIKAKADPLISEFSAIHQDYADELFRLLQSHIPLLKRYFQYMLDQTYIEKTQEAFLIKNFDRFYPELTPHLTPEQLNRIRNLSGAPLMRQLAALGVPDVHSDFPISISHLPDQSEQSTAPHVGEAASDVTADNDSSSEWAEIAIKKFLRIKQTCLQLLNTRLEELTSPESPSVSRWTPRIIFSHSPPLPSSEPTIAALNSLKAKITKTKDIETLASELHKSQESSNIKLILEMFKMVGKFRPELVKLNKIVSSMNEIEAPHLPRAK